MRNTFFILFLLLPFFLPAQSLDWLGMNSITFGMDQKQMSGLHIIIDSTTSYPDSATYVRQTRCQMYEKSGDKLQLNGFQADRIEYQFCEGKLSFVFVYVSGEEIDKALTTLKTEFRKLGCGKDTPLNQCVVMDATHSSLRVIVKVDREKKEMNFVLIPR